MANVDLSALLSPKALFEAGDKLDADAKAASDPKIAAQKHAQALEQYKQAVEVATPTPAGAHIGDGFDGPEADYGRRAAYRLAYDMQTRAKPFVDSVIAREQRGEVVQRGDQDVQQVGALLVGARRYLNAASHDGSQKPLADSDALYWLARADFDMARVLTVVPMLTGASLAFPKKPGDPQLDVSRVPSLVAASNAADEIAWSAMVARQDPKDTAAQKAERGELADRIRAQEFTVMGAIYAGAIAALSPATNGGPLRTTDGQPVQGAQLMMAMKASEYAQAVRAARGIAPNTAEQLRAMLAKKNIPVDKWKEYFVSDWDARKEAILKAHPELLTPQAKAAFEAADQNVHSTADGIH